MPILAAGRLSTVTNVIYEARKNERVTVTFSDEGGGAGTVNMYLQGATTGKYRRIGKSTSLSANSRIEVPDNGTYIHLGNNDKIHADAASGTIDYVVSGE